MSWADVRGGVVLAGWGGGQDGGMGKSTPMGKDDSARIQSAAARDPGSDTAQDEFDRRAQSAADRHEDDRDSGRQDDEDE